MSRCIAENHTVHYRTIKPNLENSFRGRLVVKIDAVAVDPKEGLAVDVEGKNDQPGGHSNMSLFIEHLYIVRSFSR